MATLLFALAAAALNLAPAQLYVAPEGNDNNAGTRQAPFKSIARAGGLARPGSTIHVAPGRYAGGFRTSQSGAPGARIAFVSTVQWGAQIVPPPVSRTDTAWDNRGSHVDIIGFQIDGRLPQNGVKWTHGIYNGGSYGLIQHNWVHHLATDVPCTSAGGSAIGVDSYYRGVDAKVVANLVHDIGPAGCPYVQGIYVSTSGTVTNNIVYRVAAAGIHLWHDATRVTINNNTVTGSHTGIIVGAGNYYFRSGPNDHTVVANNIVFDNQTGIAELGDTGKENRYINNLVYRNELDDYRLQNGLLPTGSVSADPGFVRYSRTGSPDLRLRAGSPAIGKAAPMHAPALDFAGQGRRAAAAKDIGAFQH
ncbi:DUF1565 domain-containing protein [Massilia sp. CF038]|uniref:DUF1565 domain-containing protein n=1 Tax=Massilia sp. CF038 TaxID=1881045 RepID=UPI000918A85C|nr:DUF1565 domain-containing protein [Massilia sp. CF038]SHH02697.1 parallel beta-helix repeat (two copies) [Massilia sp. CF038]